MGKFERENLSAKKLVGEIMKGLKVSEEIPKSEEESIKWLNESILPYNIFNKSLAVKDLNEECQSLFAQIREKHGKKLSDFLDEELKELAETPEGRKIKSLILRVSYPLKTPKNLKYFVCYLIFRAKRHNFILANDNQNDNRGNEHPPD